MTPTLVQRYLVNVNLNPPATCNARERAEAGLQLEGLEVPLPAIEFSVKYLSMMFYFLVEHGIYVCLGQEVWFLVQFTQCPFIFCPLIVVPI